MLTAIEQLLYQGDMAHAVVAFKLIKDRLLLAIAPTELVAHTSSDVFPLSSVAHFEDAVVTSIETIDCPHAEYWDIIGLDCRPVTADRWKFVLHTSVVEFAFESRWPHLIANRPIVNPSGHGQ